MPAPLFGKFGGVPFEVDFGSVSGHFRTESGGGQARLGAIFGFIPEQILDVLRPQAHSFSFLRNFNSGTFFDPFRAELLGGEVWFWWFVWRGFCAVVGLPNDILWMIKYRDMNDNWQAMG